MTDDRGERAAVTFRPLRPEDREFSYRVYKSSRADELAQAPWSDEQKEAFLRSQFEAQDSYYRQEFANAQFSLILRGDQAIGRIFVARETDQIQLIDIALLPEFRGGGIGTALVEELQAEARTAGKPIRLYVEVFNPALRLYQRLGFEIVEEQGPHYLMQWLPDGGGPR